MHKPFVFVPLMDFKTCPHSSCLYLEYRISTLYAQTEAAFSNNIFLFSHDAYASPYHRQMAIRVGATPPQTNARRPTSRQPIISQSNGRRETAIIRKRALLLSVRAGIANSNTSTPAAPRLLTEAAKLTESAAIPVYG